MTDLGEMADRFAKNSIVCKATARLIEQVLTEVHMTWIAPRDKRIAELERGLSETEAGAWYRRIAELEARDPEGWRDTDQTQREEIARLRADGEHSYKRIAELEGMVHSLRAALLPLSHQLLNHESDKIDPNWMFRLVRDEEDADLIGQDVLNARACIKACTVDKP